MKETARTTHRIIAFLVALALVLGAAVALSGCQSKEQQAEDAVKSMLEDYKSGTLDLLNSSESNEITNMGVDEQELASAMIEDFSYEIKGAKENSETGTIDVEVSIHSKQLVSAIKNANSEMPQYLFSALSRGASEDEMREHLASMIIDQLKNEEAVNTTVTVPTQEESGDVLATEEGKKALRDAILGDVDALQQTLSAGASELSNAA
ncbi:hypothetical protein [Anaerotardibacter muris]|uniref:hypothetical protein n=1 Tax=Anaerotardibacter muris TaxID=2941505 RepID=UPI00203F010C|nr:hypothetical protein [Anaerotardibacter muris]